MKNGRNGSFGLILVLISTLPGCAAEKELPQQAKAILSKVSEFTLYSLEPHEKADKTNSLHGEKVLGKTMVKDAAVRATAVNAGEEHRQAGKRRSKVFLAPPRDPCDA